MDAHISRTGAAGGDRIEQSQTPVGAIDGKDAHRALLVLSNASRLIGGIEPGSQAVQNQATRACSRLVNAGGRHRSRVATDLEKVYAATIAGRKIHLRWQHISKRRTERADIGNQRPAGFIRVRLDNTGDERLVPASATEAFRNERRERSGRVMTINSLEVP